MSYPVMSRDEHFMGPGPKRILTVDGGGLRGIFSLKLLKRIEDILKARHGNDDDFRLCHYFDLMAGTSTGSVVAAALALGMTVDEVRQRYWELGENVFEKTFFRRGLFRAKYDKDRLVEALKNTFGPETLLGGDELETGLLVMTKRLDTGSPWPISNNPNGRYYNGSADKPEIIANRDYPLWSVVRASTAAPAFFEGESIVIAEREGKKTQVGDFVDGGVSPHNNPSLQALMYATLSGYRVGWPTGENELFLVSVGTGSRDPGYKAKGIEGLDAIKSLVSLMDDCSALNQVMLQWMSSSPNASEIDKELGTLDGDLLGGKALLSYLRYNMELSDESLQENLNMKLDDETLKRIEKMDVPDNMPVLEDIGSRAADKLIDDSHFPGAFDLK